MRISDWSSDVCSSDLLGDLSPRFRVHRGKQSCIRELTLQIAQNALIVSTALRPFGEAPEVAFLHGLATFEGERAEGRRGAGVNGELHRHFIQIAIDEGLALGHPRDGMAALPQALHQIGSASWRERGCPYVK